VMLTSSDLPADRRRAERAGVEAFVEKARLVEGQLAPLVAGDLADGRAT
jgi:hypothetical protein